VSRESIFAKACDNGLVHDVSPEIRRHPWKWLGGVILVIVEKLAEHRALGWVNDKIDEGAGPLFNAIRDFLAFCIAHFWLSTFVILAAYCIGVVIVAYLSIWFTFGPVVSKPTAQELSNGGPVLRFAQIYTANWQPQGFKPPTVLEVKNAQTNIPNVARNVTARIQFKGPDDSQFTVVQAAWVWAKHVGSRHHEGIRGSVDLEGNESQPFVLLMTTEQGRHLVQDNGFPVGNIVTGEWEANVSIVSDNAPTLEDTIEFTVLPDNAIRWGREQGHPAFRSRSTHA
jgi:hypothetical protein